MFSTSFIEILSRDFDQAVDLLKNIQLCKYEEFFFPVNISNNHWILAIYEVRLQKLNILNSLRSSNIPEQKQNRLSGLIFLLKRYICTKMDCDLEVIYLTVPVQSNGFDCGLFVINFARSSVDVQSLAADKGAREYSFPEQIYNFSRINVARDILTLQITCDIV